MNVILISCDTWRRDHIGCYGNDWIRTPNVDRLAERSTVFEDFYCASFPTLPCRRDIITGRYEFPWRGWGGLEKDDVTLSGLINGSGRVSYFITDIYHHWSKAAGNFWCDFSGFELIRGQERDNWITDADIEPDYPAPEYAETPRIKPHLRATKLIRKNEEDWFSPQVFSRAIRWIQHNATHKDFFLMIDSFDPHEPWDPPRYYTNLYGDPNYTGNEYVTPSYRAIEGYLTEEEFKHVQAMYAGEITMVDKWMGRFLDQVETMGLMDKTMIIVTTDHGTYNGDHGQVGKLQTHMYQGISHTPMIIWHPEYGHGKRVKQLAQPIDIFPTVLEAVGLDVPENIHGRSLLRVLKDSDSVPFQTSWQHVPLRDAAIFGRFNISYNVTDGEYVLYHFIPPRSEAEIRTALIHLPSDPHEENDLSSSHPEILARMRKLLLDKLGEIGAPEKIKARLGLV